MMACASELTGGSAPRTILVRAVTVLIRSSDKSCAARRASGQ